MLMFHGCCRQHKTATVTSRTTIRESKTPTRTKCELRKGIVVSLLSLFCSFTRSVHLYHTMLLSCARLPACNCKLKVKKSTIFILKMWERKEKNSMPQHPLFHCRLCSYFQFSCFCFPLGEDHCGVPLCWSFYSSNLSLSSLSEER